MPFVKGESGNPNGRPKGNRTLSGSLKELLKADKIKLEYTVNGHKKKMEMNMGSKSNFACGIAARLVMLGMEGSLPAIKEIFDRSEGKPLQAIEDVTENTSVMPITVDKKAIKAFKTIFDSEY